MLTTLAILRLSALESIHISQQQQSADYIHTFIQSK